MAANLALPISGKFIDAGARVFDAAHATYGLTTGGSAAANGTAIRAAIAAAAAVGGVAYIPAGTYAFDGLGSITGACTIEGAGKGATILNYSGSGNGGTISGTGDGRTILKGLSLVDNGGTGAYGLQISRRVHLEDVTVDGFQNHNLYFLTGANPDTEAPYLSYLLRVTSQNSAACGVYIGSTCNLVHLVDCDIKNNDTKGIHIVSAENYVILGGQSAYNGHEGLRVESAAFGLVVGLYGEGNNTATGYADALFDASCSNTRAIFGNMQGTITVSSTDGMDVSRAGARISPLPMNLRDIDHGDDGSSTFTTKPKNGTSGFSNVLLFTNTGGGSANAYEFEVSGLGRVFRIGPTNISDRTLQVGISGGATASTPTFSLAGQSVICRSESFTDLGTTPQATFASASWGTAFRADIALTTTTNHRAIFSVHGAIESGVALTYTAFGGANCTITESPDGTFALSGLGDSRTYTLAFDTGSGTATLRADATVTGTTTLAYTLWQY